MNKVYQSTLYRFRRISILVSIFDNKTSKHYSPTKQIMTLRIHNTQQKTQQNSYYEDDLDEKLSHLFLEMFRSVARDSSLSSV